MSNIKSFPDDILLAQCDKLHPDDSHLAVAMFKILKGTGFEYVVWDVNKINGAKYEGSYFSVFQHESDQAAKVEAYTEFAKRVNSMVGGRS